VAVGSSVPELGRRRPGRDLPDPSCDVACDAPG